MAAAEIRKFLAREREFQAYLSDMDERRQPLRSMLDPRLLPGLGFFVRQQGVHWNEAWDVDEDELSDVEDEEVEAAGEGEEEEAAAAAEAGDGEDDDRPKMSAWERAVRKAFKEATTEKVGSATIDPEEAEALVRRQVRWSTREDTFKDSLVKFNVDWAYCLSSNGLKDLFMANERMQKRAIKVLCEQLQPERFRRHIIGQTDSNDIRKVADWFEMVAGKEERYNGLIEREDRDSGIKRTEGTSDDVKGGTASFKDRGRDRFKHKVGSGTGGGEERKCFHCGRTNHLAKDCYQRPRDPPTKESRRGTSPKFAAKRAGSSHDGLVRTDFFEVPFVLDTGASETLISEKHATRALDQPGVTTKRFKKPLLIKTAKRGEEGETVSRYSISLPATLILDTGERHKCAALEFYVVEELDDSEILLSRKTLKTLLGLDVKELLRDLWSSETEPWEKLEAKVKRANVAAALASGRSTAESESQSSGEESGDEEDRGSRGHWAGGSWRRTVHARRMAVMAEPEEDELPPAFAEHDSSEVKVALEKTLDSAEEAGLPAPQAKRLRKAVLGPMADAFRLHLSNDPPARVPPIKVKVDDEVFKMKRQGRRRYSPIDSLFMKMTMQRLEKFGFVFKNSFATVTSPAYPVTKADVDPSAPLEQRKRLTVDLRAVNRHTVPIKYPLPRLETFVETVAGARFFGKMDLSNGYWQLPLDESCQEYFSIETDAGVWTPRRLIQGSRNAAGPFQAVMVNVLGDMVNTACVVYIDDILIYAKTAEEFVTNWINVMQRLNDVGLKISAKKTTFYAPEVKFCGRIFSASGVRFDDEYVAAVTKMAKPITAAELRSYLASANWLRMAIYNYAELAEPLQQLLTESLRRLPGVTKSEAKKALLADTGWNDTHDQAFAKLNAAIANAAVLAYPDDDLVTCVFTDASKFHWAGVVTQVPREDLDKPLLQQRHRPLAFVSGSFRGSQLNWPTVEKEGFGIVETCKRLSYILQRPGGFVLHTDHNNLKYLFNPDTRVTDGTRAAADRIERWIVTMRGFQFSIQHVPGVDNLLADLLSRWAVPVPEDEIVAKVAAIRRQSERLRAIKDKQKRQDAVRGEAVAKEARQDAGEGEAVRAGQRQDAVEGEAVADKRRLDASKGEAVDKKQAAEGTSGTRKRRKPDATPPATATDQFALDNAVRFGVEDAPSEVEITRVQRTVITGELKERLGLTATEGGTLVDQASKIFVPDSNCLRLRLCVVAHQGPGGHRGTDTTLTWIKDRFTWPNMDRDVAMFCRSCLHCVRVRGGKVVPRPWLDTPRATERNQILHFDYMEVRKPEALTADKLKYVLVLMDGFSRFVELVPTASATAAATADALLAWFGRYGVVRQWVSDQGTHFLNEVMERLAGRLGVQHRFTATYAPWSNGQVERVNREIREILTTLRLETRLTEDQWPNLLPVVTSVLNNTPTAVLNGIAPRTAFLGLPATSPLDVVFQTEARDFAQPAATLSKDDFKRKVEELRQLMYAIHESVTQAPARLRKDPRGAKEVDFDVGDFVLVAKLGPGAKDKTLARWEGPARVIRQENPRVFVVRDLVTLRERTLHCAYLKRYADRELHVTPQLLEFIAHGGSGYVVEAIVDHRKHHGKWQLKIKWEGFEDAGEDSWEPLERLIADVPALVRTYVKTISDKEARATLTALTRRGEDSGRRGV